jgi:aspartate--ammonia ligase
LAKWKRYALAEYGFETGTGLYTDMNAIRRDEICDATHSIYVDQWDWEKVITAADRTEAYLKATVRSIYGAIVDTARIVGERYPALSNDLPAEIHFVTSQELEDRYPSLTPEARESAAIKDYGAMFVMQIGGKLRSGIRHGGRAPITTTGRSTGTSWCAIRCWKTRLNCRPWVSAWTKTHCFGS